MNHGGLTPKTVQRILSALRGYWRYLQSIEVAGEDDEPFQKLDVARGRQRRNPADERQPFEPRDVVKLWKEAKTRDDQDLADLIELGMYTGARIEELCALKLEKVAPDYFKIEDAKTPAGWREVPIHSKLRKAVVRLKKASKDGYLLSGLPANKYGDRSNAIGKRFGYLKTAMGFGPQFVFHSVRKTVSTQFENASVPENVAAGIIGHEFPTMTFGLYSGGPALKLKRKAIEKLRYPA
jgi:integrase